MVINVTNHSQPPIRRSIL